MKYTRYSLIVAVLIAFTSSSEAQINIPKFGKGLQLTAQDSSFYMKIGFRFQTLFLNEWNLEDDNLSSMTDHESSIFIRRSRLKFDGWALSPKLKFKAELSLSNRDNGGGNSSRFSNAANIILEAAEECKYPGNRERIISSGNLQFVDRSRLNSRYTLDRDVGVMLKNKSYLGDEFILKQIIAIGSGEGKNITSGNIGGHAYTFKLEALPFGEFASKGDYTGSDIKREPTPKLAIALAYDTNIKAGRTRGQKGSFFTDSNENPYGKNINSIFADLMFKYNGLSIMAEYAHRETDDGSPFIVGELDENIATYYTGSATNIAIGKMLSDSFEIAGRWTNVKPDEGVASNENQYTLGFSKYIVGHKLKVQTDIVYRVIETSEDDLIYRLQMDIHF